MKSTTVSVTLCAIYLMQTDITIAIHQHGGVNRHGIILCNVAQVRQANATLKKANIVGNFRTEIITFYKVTLHSI